MVFIHYCSIYYLVIWVSAYQQLQLNLHCLATIRVLSGAKINFVSRTNIVTIPKVRNNPEGIIYFVLLDNLDIVIVS